MDKLKFETPDMVSGNIDKIAALFPAAITEMRGEDGEIKRGVNFEVLKQLLSRDVVDGDECYEFTWVGKKAAMAEAARPITKTLRPVKEDSRDWDTTENLYIEGDNLEVLKLLQESYLGKVKMIYIDPPYNTGHDFVYNDNFVMSKDKYDDLSGRIDDDGNISRRENNTSNPQFHSDWCSMIYSRLLLARNLLSEDGVIFISIDNNEQENLKRICDETVGASNFVGELILKTATDNNPSQINTEHEYMLCYAKNRQTQTNWLRTSEAAKRIIERYEILKPKYDDISDIQTELRRWIKENRDKVSQVAHYNCVDEKGVYSCSSNSSNPHPGGYMYDIIHPITGLACSKPANGWRWPEKTFLSYQELGEIEWGKDETTQPHVKKRIETAVDYLRSLIYEDNRATTKMLSDLFNGRKVFDNPKPLAVIIRLLDYVTNSGSLVLDFFSGSATTAHAVMQLNAEDGGHRKFIMVQLPEKCDESSEAYKAGYKNICEIGKERIRRAGDKIKAEHPDAHLDTGFRVFRVDESNMEDVYYHPEELTQTMLGGMVSNIKSDRSDLDLLYACLLDWGVEINLPHSVEKLDGCTIHNVDDGALVACFDENVPDTVIRRMADLHPLRAVFRDSSFASDDSKINVTEIFKNLSPDTNVKVI